MDAAINPFEELGLDLSATDEQVKAAWRRAVMKYHPDRNPDASDAPERFARAQRAYERLKDAESRAAAVRQVRATMAAKKPRSADHAMFDDFFRKVDESAAPWTRTGVAPTEGADTRRTLALSLEQAFKGGVFAIEHGAAKCHSCEGSGRQRFAGMASCPQCLGEGTLRAAAGTVRLKAACPTCEGRKRVPWVICQECGGVGQVRAISADVEVPPGVQTGHQIVLEGLGAPGLGGARSGNLLVDVEVRAHPSFAREGATDDDLWAALDDVGLAEWARGRDGSRMSRRAWRTASAWPARTARH